MGRWHRRRSLLPAWLAAVLLLVAGVPPAPAAGETMVRVGLYDNSPKVGRDADGQPEGIFVDILAAIAEREGWRLEYVPGTWQEGLDRLADGRIDIMPDVAWSTERAERYVFPREPVLVSWSQVYARDGTSIRSLLDLHDKRVATLAGSIQHDEFAWLLKGFHIEATLAPHTSFEAAFAAVRDGAADAVVANRFYGERHAAQYKLVDTGIVFSPAELHFAMRRDVDPALLGALDRRLRELKQDGGSAYYRALRRWTGNDTEPLPDWLWWAAGALVGLLLLSLAWISVLRRNAQRMRAADALQRRLLIELASAKEAAESADRAKSSFVATMSHELRTPLTAVIGYTDLVLGGTSGPLTEKQRQQLGTVRSSADHLLALINDALDIARIDANQLQLASDPVDAEASIRKVAGIMQPLADARGLYLEVAISGPLGTLVGDARRLEQILLNLLGNAIKFTGAGGVTLRAMRGRDAKGTEVLRLEVADTGPGIRAEDLPRLFRPFSQLRATRAQAAQGTGLGLAICRSLAEMMGGSIGVESRQGAGSTFTVMLPVLPPAQPGHTPPA
jgi:signal transduction histidine kinase